MSAPDAIMAVLTKAKQSFDGVTPEALAALTKASVGEADFDLSLSGQASSLALSAIFCPKSIAKTLLPSGLSSLF